jgi:deoxyadenosine/deoxycytidine kinase
VLKKVFLYPLVVLNDLGLLKFLRAFVDSTDALVNGSKHYTLTRDEFKALKLMKKWNLLHKNTLKSKNNVKKKLYWKQKEFESDEEISNLIVLILRRLDLYNKKIFNRIGEFEESFNQTNKDYISISFPSAVMLPTKKGNNDFGFNLQEIMTENNIIITGLLLRKPNDNMAMDEILSELKENFKLLLELMEKYGCRRNYKEIKKMLEKAIFVFDSGYYSDKNLESADKHENQRINNAYNHF